MIKSEKFWLKESQKLVWFKKPSVAIRKENNNKDSWFSDGLFNVYDNLCTICNLKIYFLTDDITFLRCNHY